MRRQLPRSYDDGFSLTELLVVLALLGVVLGGIYAFSYAVTVSARGSEFQATAARETGTVLMLVEKHLMQEIRIEQASPYRVQFLTDRKLDGDLKRHVLEATADGRVVLTTWATLRETAWPNAGSPTVAVLAHESSNVADGVPFLNYIRRDGTELIGSEIAEAAYSDTRSIRVNMSVKVRDRTHLDSRLIMLRNRE